MKTKHLNHKPRAVRKTSASKVDAPPKPSQRFRACGVLPIALWEALSEVTAGYEAERLALHMVALGGDASQSTQLATLAGVLVELGALADSTRESLWKEGYCGERIGQPAEELRQFGRLERRVLRVMEKVAARPTECRGWLCGGLSPATTVDTEGRAVCSKCAAFQAEAAKAMSASAERGAL